MHDLFADILDEIPALKKEFTSNDSYVNSRGFESMLESINYLIEKEIVSKIGNSPYISLLIDDTTCNSKKENLVIFVKYFDQQKQQTQISYLKNVVIANTTGKSIFEKIISILTEYKIDKTNIFGMSTDGAESMISIVNGVVGYFLRLNPFLLNSHCYLHKLALASKDTTKEINYRTVYIDILHEMNFSKNPKLYLQKMI